ncbi:conserved hypothetical protein [Thiomonas arsenitoxydans]|uniref:hypothetical protein n=1 Tax=Thiomonas TaxID=32012 RepID=UPI0007C3CA0A|nr:MULTISPECIES: hypothetical protein [Thiomonas]CQR29463.1 conserved hypothetical protein [Thiomonas arsenitoxydans]CQR29477.1 conserved hypothetical protein [Thiomonas arsenitoxydans]
MPLTEKEAEELRKLIKERVENYPDLVGLVAEGRLIKKSGWYEAQDKQAFDAIIKYATAVEINQKSGKARIKVAPQSRRLAALSKKL